MYFEVKNAKYIDNYNIEIEFENGNIRVVNFEYFFAKYKHFEAIKDSKKFKKFSVKYRTLIWEENDIDISPESLYLFATGDKEISWNSRISKAI